MFQLGEPEFEEAKGWLQDLIRIDTTNPPGNERPAIDYIDNILRAAGLETTILEPVEGRANLVARIRGDGSEKPLMLSSHVDVVPASADGWTHPPFSGVEADGCIWGRGAIDMKGFAVMALAVFRQVQRSDTALKRDLIFTSVCDEEAGCQQGSAWMVENHPDLVTAEYVINEVGGFTVYLNGRRHYYVQRAERGIAWLRIHLRGKPGHSSQPWPESAVGEAGRIMDKLSRARLPHHLTQPAVDFLDAISEGASAIERNVLQSLKKPRLGRTLLHSLIPAGAQRKNLQALLSNTVNPTVVKGGSKINVIPAHVSIDVDGRTVPDSSAAELIKELRAIIGPEPEIEVLLEEPASASPLETEMYAQIQEVLGARDPEASVLPGMIAGFTDSRHWARLGATCYGFYPLQLPPEMDFSQMFHGIDERIPLDGFRFGIECLYDLVLRMAGR